MAKTKTSKKREKSFLETLPSVDLDPTRFDVHNPSKTLLNEQTVALALYKCMLDNDKEAYMEILRASADARNKAALMRATGLAKNTFYDAFKNNNPSLETLCKIVKGLGQKTS